MARFVKIFCATAVLAVTMLFATPNRAFATFEFEVEVSTDNGNSWTLAKMTYLNPNELIATYSNSNFSFSATYAITNTPGNLVNGATLGQSEVFLETSGLWDPNAVHDLDVRVSATDYTIPQDANAVLSSSSDLDVASGSVTEVFTSYVNTSDALFGVTGGAVTATDPLTLTETNPSGSDSTSFGALGTYSLTNEMDFTITGQANQIIIGGGTGDTAVTTPVPSSAVLALSGLPLLGLGCWMRRKRRQAVLAA